MKQFKAESKRILDLMINSIYTNKDIFLRELISNASDAIDKLRFISLTDKNVKTDFKIKLSFDKDAKIIVIEDNGIGMNENDLEKNLGTIAESGTLAFKKQNQDEKELIGQFGVGFYSAFMVAEEVEVLTKKYGEESGYLFTSKGVEGYSITKCEKQEVGTKITLKLKEDTEEFKYSDFLDQYKITSLIKQYSDYIRYPIEMPITRSTLKEGTSGENREYVDKTEIEILNSMLPIWKKPKAEVTKQALDEFYKSEFHDFNNPLKSVHAKIEGSVTFDTLLFFPEKASYDFYTKDFKKGLKLYSSGVMIMEKCEELLPDYFGFVKGIVDSADLSLNISREILQQDRQVKTMAIAIEKKIIAELKKLIETERETYEKIFNEFGVRIKFGIYEGFGMNKDKLKDLVLFYSSKKQKLITLKEYVKDMPLSEDNIYYACGNSYQAIDKLPQVDGAKDKGFDILYFKDGVDEFVVKILGEYEGKKFKSVTDADFITDSEEEKKELEAKNQDYKDVLDFIKEYLKDKVKEARLSNKLKSYPACLTSGGELSIEMEKVLNAMPNSDGKVKAEKILELNANHKVIEKLKDLFVKDKEMLKKYITVLYEQARLLEGLQLDDLNEYIKAVSEII